MTVSFHLKCPGSTGVRQNKWMEVACHVWILPDVQFMPTHHIPVFSHENTFPTCFQQWRLMQFPFFITISLQPLAPAPHICSIHTDKPEEKTNITLTILIYSNSTTLRYFCLHGWAWPFRFSTTIQSSIIQSATAQPQYNQASFVSCFLKLWFF